MTTDPAIARTLARHPRPLGGDPLKRIDRPLVSLSGLILNNDQSSQLAVKRKPPADWSDVTVAWKDADTLVLQYDPAGGGERKSIDRKLAAGDWKRS